MTAHDIVVLGGGYAGTPAAGRLARRLKAGTARVTLVNASPLFVERPRLHQLAAGQERRRLALTDYVDRVVVDRATAIDPDRRLIRLTSGRELAYDTLVYALGSTVDTASVPGVAEHAHALTSPDAAHRLHAAAAGLDGGVLAVCGGGLTGIEAAAEFAESFPRLTVRLFSRTAPGGHMDGRARRHLERAFRRLGVEVHADAEVAAVQRGGLVLADGRTPAFDACLWAGGFTVPPLAREAGLAVRPDGRALVDASLRSVSHPDVYVIGDAVAAAGAWGAELAYGCRTGGVCGPYVADAITERLRGREPRPFRFRYVHECVSLGRRDAVIQFLHADQSPARVLTGRPAVRYKNTVLDSARWLFAHPGPYLPRGRS